MELTERVLATIKKHSMLTGGETVVVGLSGGPDSVCLVTVLHTLKSRMELNLSAVYVEHGLRPDETPDEIEFSGDLCRRMDIPFSVKQVDVRTYAKEKGLNAQDAARTLRYKALEETAAGAGAHAVALGHNLDDQAETFLMHILRGSGPRGLSGIPPVRGIIIRPLIDIERKDIEEHLDSEGISYMIDSSNLKHDYLRNRLRATIMPVLRDINPGIIETLSRTTEILRDEDRYLEAAVTKTLMKLITRKTDTSIELFLVPLEGMDRVLLRRVLRRAIDATEGLRAITFRHIEDIMHLIKTGSAGARLYLPRDGRVVKKYSTVLLTSEPPQKLGTYALEPGGEVVLQEAGLVLKAYMAEAAPAITGKDIALFDAEKVKGPLTVRARRDGDYFYPEGFGKRKKLQDYFVNEKVPRDERDIVPIVTSGEDVVWVAGMRADNRFAADHSAEKPLVLELKKLKD
jgi:tRNA(Ile)-lysidine synthase